jgi:hypothetical protein
MPSARTARATGKWGYIDKQAKFAINTQFGYKPGQFSEGLGIVLIGDYKTGKWGYIDKQGKFTINPQFDDANQFIA